MRTKGKSMRSKPHPTASGVIKREKAGEELRANQEVFRDFCEHANDLIQSVDTNERFVYVNKKWLETLGYTKEEVKNLKLTDILRKDQIPHCMELFKRVRSGESLERVEAVFTSKDGRETYVEGNISPRFRNGSFVSTIGIFRNVTERKQAEEALAKRTHDLGERVKELSCLYAISNLASKKGVSLQETLNEIVDLIPPAWQYPEITCARITLERQEFRTGNFRETIWKQTSDIIVQGDRIGSLEVCYLEEKPEMDEGPFLKEERNLLDAIAQQLGTITKRKRAEDALRESEESLRHLFENANDLIQSVDIDGKFDYVNRKWLETLAYSKEEVQELKLTDILREDQIPHCMELFERVCGGELLKKVETVFVSKGGREVYVEGDVSGRFKDGRFVSTRGIFRDVTERKWAEEALRRSEEKLRRYLESSPDGIYTNDLKGTFLYGNRAAEKLIGYSREELIGKNFLELDLLPPEHLPKAAQNLELNATGRPTGPDEFELIRKDGSRVFVEISTFPIGQGEETEVIGIARDITERKRMERQLQLAGRLAAVGELAAGVAHELNNPLAAVQAFAQLLNDRDDLDETTRSDVETIYRETQRASRITSKLLSFARRQEPERRLISINEVIEKALELHAYRMKVDNIDLAMELDPHLPMTMADSDQMEQVFVNIINNAEQAMIEAHGRGRLRVKTQKVDEMIQIAFIDDGPGIPEENLKRMFDPFFTTKDVGKGTGLGLSICYGIVEAHGGHMSVKSRIGEGATFSVEMPIVAEDQPLAQQTDLSHVPGVQKG